MTRLARLALFLFLHFLGSQDVDAQKNYMAVKATEREGVTISHRRHFKIPVGYNKRKKANVKDDVISCEFQQYQLRNFNWQFFRIPIGMTWATLAMDCSSDAPEYEVRVRKPKEAAAEMAMELRTKERGVMLFERISHEVMHVFVNGEQMWNESQMQKYGIMYDYVGHDMLITFANYIVTFDGYISRIYLRSRAYCQQNQCAGLCGRCGNLVQHPNRVPPIPLIPDEIDWIARGAVTPAKNQGKCRANWAFAATGSIEGQIAVNYAFLVELSAQNLIDCAFDPFGGKDGCDGGVPELAYEYIYFNAGIDSEASYKYNGARNRCGFNRSSAAAFVVDSRLVQHGNELALKALVATKGPVAAIIDGSQPSFRSYKKGVYYEPACSSDNVRLSVLIVGYGSDEKQQDFWLIKNSWGTEWGDNGYMRIARNRNNHCGIASHAFDIVAYAY